MQAGLDDSVNALKHLRETPKLAPVRKIVEGCGGKLNAVASIADGRQLKVA